MKTSVSRLLLAGALAAAGSLPAAAAEVHVVEGQLVGWTRSLERPRPIPVPVLAQEAVGTYGGRVFFTAEPGEAPPNSDAWVGTNLWSAGLDGRNARRIVDGQGVTRAVWSRAAGLLAVATTEMEVLVMRPDGSKGRRVATGASPAFSPDGRLLAYAAPPSSWRPGTLPGAFDLRVVDLKTGKHRTLTSGYDDAEPIWTPDGAAVLFLSGARTGLTSLWRIQADGSGLAQITNVGEGSMTETFVPNPTSNLDPQWSRDGRSLLYAARYTDAGEVIVLDFDEGLNVREARDLGPGLAPVWHGDSPAVLVSSPGGIQAEERGAPRKIIDVQDSARRGDTEVRRPLADAAASEDEATTALAAPPRYRWPLSFHPSGYYYYYDNNSSSGTRSWACDSRTYNGHRGTDTPASCGTPIYAGAYGSVSTRNDGCPNVGYRGSSCGGGFGNYIKLNNGDSWYSIYAHMRAGTPIGYGTVNCGALLGISGTSGNSSGCHLHFEVQRYGYPQDDPFQGSCSGPETFWCNQNGDGNGRPSRVCCS